MLQTFYVFLSSDFREYHWYNNSSSQEAGKQRCRSCYKTGQAKVQQEEQLLINILNQLLLFSQYLIQIKRIFV